MSTRCQVEIVPGEGSYGTPVIMYHHYDGYPEVMIPIIRNAYERFVVQAEDSHDLGIAASADHVAVMVASADPLGFEVEQTPQTTYPGRKKLNPLHGDIEYFYRVYPTFKDGNVHWDVECYAFDGVEDPNYYTLGAKAAAIPKMDIVEASKSYWEAALKKGWVAIRGGPGLTGEKELRHLCRVCRMNEKTPKRLK